MQVEWNTKNICVFPNHSPSSTLSTFVQLGRKKQISFVLLSPTLLIALSNAKKQRTFICIPSNVQCPPNERSKKTKTNVRRCFLSMKFLLTSWMLSYKYQIIRICTTKSPKGWWDNRQEVEWAKQTEPLLIGPVTHPNPDGVTDSFCDSLSS